MNKGPINGTGYTRLQNEPICSQLCGKLFPKAYQPQACPCHKVKTPGYVKHIFWNKLNKAQKAKKET